MDSSRVLGTQGKVWELDLGGEDMSTWTDMMGEYCGVLRLSDLGEHSSPLHESNAVGAGQVLQQGKIPAQVSIANKHSGPFPMNSLPGLESLP